ncbi:hypothetical protein ACGGAI_23985 [Streptomyces antibioticus]|uniref:DUF7426 family protein n=1 Tax=Streptomyces antibioticus TaxID=1890 RepID=UPI0037187FC4
MATDGEDFEALDEFLDDYLELPVKGRDGQTRVYRIEDPEAEDGIRIERITTLAARLAAGGKAPDTQVLDDDEERDLFRMCLGDVYDQLLADGVRWARFKHVALTAMFWITADKATALEFWRSGQGKAPNRAARRAQARPGGSGSAAASSTRSQGSTSGTRAGSRRRGRGRSRS